MKTLFHAAALMSMLVTATAPHAQPAAPAAERMFDATTLSLSAYGEVKAAPDQATITLGVQSTAATAAGAMRENAAQMAQVMDALHRAGVADKDIQTSDLSLNAQYVYDQNQPPKLTGYQASNDVAITVENLAQLGPIIDAVTTAGANQVSGISFGLRDPTVAENAARLAAVKALSAKAELYAGATGYRLARLVNLSEGAAAPSGPVRPMMAMARVAATPTPVSSGELTVRTDVTGVYELTR
jgi:uncharacterized protein